MGFNMSISSINEEAILSFLTSTLFIRSKGKVYTYVKNELQRVKKKGNYIVVGKLFNYKKLVLVPEGKLSNTQARKIADVVAIQLLS